jgi:hypothetical protein
MADHTEPDLKARHKQMIVRGIAAALLLAVLSLAEYYVAIKMDDPTWALVPFMVVKGWVVLDTFMHVRALSSKGAH